MSKVKCRVTQKGVSLKTGEYCEVGDEIVISASKAKSLVNKVEILKAVAAKKPTKKQLAAEQKKADDLEFDAKAEQAPEVDAEDVADE